jgi:OOP family OmpA-OmpF porin
MSARFNCMLMAAALGGLLDMASAQQPPDVDLQLQDPVTQSPYVVNSSKVVVRNSAGLCWRTGHWTPELAAEVKVVGRDKPIGCYCDEGMMPKAVCAPPPPPVVGAPPAAEPMPVPVTPPPVALAEKATIAADALFDFDRATLTPVGKQTLDDFLGKLKGLKLEAIVAVGHTDRIGTTAYNARLSESRAGAVKAYLVQQGGLPAQQVYVEGKGELSPVTKDCVNMGKENQANKKLVACLTPDRRVEIEAVGSR